MATRAAKEKGRTTISQRMPTTIVAQEESRTLVLIIMRSMPCAEVARKNDNAKHATGKSHNKKTNTKWPGGRFANGKVRRGMIGASFAQRNDNQRKWAQRS